MSFKIGCLTTDGDYVETSFKIFDIEHMKEALRSEARRQSIEEGKLLFPDFFESQNLH